MAALARSAGISISRLQHQFKVATGVCLSKTLVAFRLPHAASLLTSGRPQVKVAQIDAGFADAANFSHAFRKHFGVSPSDFRGAVNDSLLRSSGQQVLPTTCTCPPVLVQLLCGRLSASDATVDDHDPFASDSLRLADEHR